MATRAFRKKNSEQKKKADPNAHVSTLRKKDYGQKKSRKGGKKKKSGTKMGFLFQKKKGKIESTCVKKPSQVQKNNVEKRKYKSNGKGRTR